MIAVINTKRVMETVVRRNVMRFIGMESMDI
jgi:hypothetical protein